MWNLDYNAGAPLDPRIARAMARLPAEADGNPASPHGLGRAARSILEAARESLADGLAVRPEEILFTSGGTEANNIAILSGFEHAARRRQELWLSPIEHPSVLVCSLHLAKSTGIACRTLRIGADGRCCLPPAEEAQGKNAPAFLSLILAQHETGVIHDLAPFAVRLHATGGLLHTDASQALGRIDLATATQQVDYMTLTPHKVGGPRGIGILIIKKGRPLATLLAGGSQELGRRAGTVSPRLAVGAAESVLLALGEREERAQSMHACMQAFLAALPAASCKVLFADCAALLPNTRSLNVKPVPARLLLPALDMEGIYVSYGSACSSGASVLSPSLLASCKSEQVARCCLRASIGPNESSKKIEEAGALFSQVLKRFQN